LATLLLAVHRMISRLRLQVHALGQKTASALAACWSCCSVILTLCMTAFISYSKFAMYAALLSQDNIAIVSQKPFLWHASFWFPYIFDTVMF